MNKLSQPTDVVSPFPGTHWSVVLAAGESKAGGAAEALEKLCEAYWMPLCAFARRLGYSAADAQDLTQGFFSHLIESRLVGRAEAGKGRFRSFLLGSFKNFISHDQERAAAQRRGGGHTIVSLDAQEAELLLNRDLTTELSPDALYDRRWALVVLHDASKRMEAEFNKSGRGELFEKLFPCLQGEHGTASYAAIAQALGTTEGTIKVTVSRMRQRYRELLASIVAQTVASPAEIEEELQQLMAALRR